MRATDPSGTQSRRGKTLLRLVLVLFLVLLAARVPVGGTARAAPVAARPLPTAAPGATAVVAAAAGTGGHARSQSATGPGHTLTAQVTGGTLGVEKCAGRWG